MPPVERRFSSGSRMYQFDTSSMPSGIDERAEDDDVVQDPERLRIGLGCSADRSSRSAAARRAPRWHAGRRRSTRPILPSRASCRAWSSVRPSASASCRFASLISGSFRWFSGDVMMAVYSVRPSSVLPMSTTVIRSDCASSFLQVVDVLRVVDEAVVVADVEAELFLRRRHLRRRRRPVLRLRHGNRQAREEQHGRGAGLQGSLRMKHGNLVSGKGRMRDRNRIPEVGGSVRM